jgi:hypothetical protein
MKKQIMIPHTRTSAGKALLGSSIIVVLCCILLSDCSKKQGGTPAQLDSATVNAVLRDGDPLDECVQYEVTEDKQRTASYYDLPEMKEWYIKRVLPPSFDFNVDLARQTYLQLRLLRYEIFARNGYLFRDAALRAYFNAFDWYQPVFDVPEFKAQINAQEKAFLEKVTVRENEELQHRLVDVQGNTLVSMNHVINLNLFTRMGDSMRTALQSMNMAIVPASHDQLFSVYDENQYASVPNFITTDLYLQVLHKHLSGLMQDAEDQTLIKSVRTLLTRLRSKASALAGTEGDTRTRNAASWADTYLAVALTVMTGTPEHDVRPEFAQTFRKETEKVMAAQGQGSEFLNRKLLEYSQFKPRGNYTDTERRRGYFRCVKWLNSAPMNVDDDASLMAAMLMGLWVNEDESCRANFARVDTLMTILAGEEDNLSLTHVASTLRNVKVHTVEQLFEQKTIDLVRKSLLAEKASRIEPKVGNALARDEFARKAVLFTAGRYSIDGDVLSRMVHVERPDTLRPFPRALDVFAAMGNATAERILNETYQERQRWPAFGDSLNAAKELWQRYDGSNTGIYNRTLECIASLGMRSTDELPLVMRTHYWHEKNLSTSLAAWTELKHDMILYSEQPIAAEAGEGGGPEPPVQLSFVEPNVPFWTKTLELLGYQDTVLSALGALSEDMKNVNRDLKDLAGFLLYISKKELAKQRITTKEFGDLTWIGGRVEGLTFRALKTDHLPEREQKIALVADVYSRNGVALEEGIGSGDELYVIVEINGLPYLTKGACFSYYEFKSETRLSDEEWQTLLSKPGRPERPEWVKHLLVNPGSAFEKGKSPVGNVADHH